MRARSLFCCLALASCTRPSLPPPAAPPPAAPAAPVDVAHALRWSVPKAPYEAPALVGADAAGTRFYVVGGMRATVDARGVMQVAHEGLAAPIAYAGEANGGWRFVAGNAVLEAAHFLDAPRVVFNAAQGAPGWGAGRPVFAHDGALTGAPFSDSERALDAAFADAQRGLAVSEPGRLWVTADAGAHWSRVPLDDAPLRVFADARGLFVQGVLHRWAITDGAAHIDDDALPRALPGDEGDVLASRLAVRLAGLWRPMPSAVAGFAPDELLVAAGSQVLRWSVAARAPIDGTELHLDGAATRVLAGPTRRFVELAGPASSFTLYELFADRAPVLRMRGTGCVPVGDNYPSLAPNCVLTRDERRVMCPMATPAAQCQHPAHAMILSPANEVVDLTPPTTGDEVFTSLYGLSGDRVLWELGAGQPPRVVFAEAPNAPIEAPADFDAASAGDDSGAGLVSEREDEIVIGDGPSGASLRARIAVPEAGAPATPRSLTRWRCDDDGPARTQGLPVDEDESWEQAGSAMAVRDAHHLTATWMLAPTRGTVFSTATRALTLDAVDEGAGPSVFWYPWQNEAARGAPLWLLRCAGDADRVDPRCEVYRADATGAARRVGSFVDRGRDVQPGLCGMEEPGAELTFQTARVAPLRDGFAMLLVGAPRAQSPVVDATWVEATGGAVRAWPLRVRGSSRLTLAAWSDGATAGVLRHERDAAWTLLHPERPDVAMRLAWSTVACGPAARGALTLAAEVVRADGDDTAPTPAHATIDMAVEGDHTCLRGLRRTHQFDTEHPAGFLRAAMTPTGLRGFRSDEANRAVPVRCALAP